MIRKMFLLRHLVVDAIDFISILHFSLPLPVFNLQQYKQDVCVMIMQCSHIMYVPSGLEKKQKRNMKSWHFSRLQRLNCATKLTIIQMNVFIYWNRINSIIRVSIIEACCALQNCM